MTTHTRKVERAVERISKLVGWKYSGNITHAAKAMRVPYFTLYNPLAGRTSPSLELIARCADHFEVSFDSLMADDKENAK